MVSDPPRERHRQRQALSKTAPGSGLERSALLEELPHRWRAHAALLRRYKDVRGAEICNLLAAELEMALQAAVGEMVTLEQGAALSGYSKDHLSRLIRDGRIPNAGRRNAPLIRRGDLPTKPGTGAAERAKPHEQHYDMDGLFRDIVHSKFGGDDV